MVVGWAVRWVDASVLRLVDYWDFGSVAWLVETMAVVKVSYWVDSLDVD